MAAALISIAGVKLCVIFAYRYYQLPLRWVLSITGGPSPLVGVRQHRRFVPVVTRFRLLARCAASFFVLHYIPIPQNWKHFPALVHFYLDICLGKF